MLSTASQGPSPTPAVSSTLPLPRTNLPTADTGDDDDDDDDLPPPLENASAEVASTRAAAAALQDAVRARLDKERERGAKRHVDTTTLADKTPRVSGPPSVSGNVASAGAKSSGLAGMKRGFLNSSCTKQSNASDSNPDDMVHVGTSNGKKKEDPLVFSEVQEALKEAAKGQLDPNLYVTPSLLGTIDSDAHLRSTFDDAGFGEFLGLVQKDPLAAQKKYDPRTNPRAQRYWDAMKRVTGLMGSELEKNAPPGSSASSTSSKPAPSSGEGVPRPKIEVLDDDAEAKSSKPPPTSRMVARSTPVVSASKQPAHSDLPPHERALVERVQGDARVREALMDPQVQRFLDGMRRGGGGVELGQFMSHASRNPHLMAKVKVLMEVGLLQVQR